jgi:hypothetical protein
MQQNQPLASDPALPGATFPGPARRIRVEPLIPEPEPSPREPSPEPEPPLEEPQPEPVPVPVP